MTAYTFLLVSTADLQQLATGHVPPTVRRRAAVLGEDLDHKLRRNAARRVRTIPRTGAKVDYERF